MRGFLARIRNEERGSVFIVVAGFLPIAVLLAAWVIDLGNGAEHRRQLQLQADAGALAAAQEFVGCRNNPDAANEAIHEVAVEYASSQNVQVGGAEAQDRVRTVINGTGYSAADNSLGEPCETGFVDVKLTEEDSPAFFDFVGSHDWQAHARVQVLKVNALNGLLPLAVPVPDFDSAAAIFVDESTGDPLSDANGDDLVVPLQRTGNEDGLTVWETEEAATVPIQADHVGVRIALSNGSSTDCANTGVTCYDAGNATDGLVHIQGWSAVGTVTQNPDNGTQGTPRARSVKLVPGSSCDDPYFSSASRPCDEISIAAVVDFGGPPENVGGDLVAEVNGDEYAMSPDAANPTTAPWSTDAAIPITAGAGPIDVELKWIETKGKIGSTDCAKNKNRPCEGTFGVVQRHFSANEDRSGPIELVELSEGATEFPNSLQRCSVLLASCDHELDVKIGIGGSLELSTATGGPQYLRAAGGTGSLTQALACNVGAIDPDAELPDNFKEELASGCTTWYTINQGTDCPDSLSELIEPYPCVPTAQGNKTNQVAEGLNRRILGDPQPQTCPPAGAFGHNNWPNYRSGDPRIVQVFLTSFGAFDGSGATTVPVTGFATFYITGWKGQGDGFDNPCQGNGDEIPEAPGDIVGRYIAHVDIPNDGGTSPDSCDFNDIRPCTAVLVD